MVLIFVIRVVEKLANTERHLDISKNHALRAEDNTDEIKKLNKSIFNPSAAFTLNKEAKRMAKEERIQARYNEDREERERTLADIRDSQNTVGKAATYGLNESGNRQLTQTEQGMRKAQRARYQFEATQSDDEAEDELDGNLGEIGEAAKRLKALGMAMGQELDTQNNRIDRISDKATALDNRMFTNTEKVSFALVYIFIPLCSPLLVAQAHQVIHLFTAFRGRTEYQKGVSPSLVAVDYRGLEYPSSTRFCTIYKGLNVLGTFMKALASSMFCCLCYTGSVSTHRHFPNVKSR